MRRWLPFLLWMSLVTGIILSADCGWVPWLLFYIDKIPYGDKLGHVILVGTLAFFLNHALGKLRVPILTKRVLLGGLLVAVAITLEEISQIWIPGRTFDLGDLAANYTGVCLAGFLASPSRPKALRSPETFP